MQVHVHVGLHSRFICLLGTHHFFVVDGRGHLTVHRTTVTSTSSTITSTLYITYHHIDTVHYLPSHQHCTLPTVTSTLYVYITYHHINTVHCLLSHQHCTLHAYCHINTVYCLPSHQHCTLPTIASTLTSTSSTITLTPQRVPCHIAQPPGPP